MQSNNKLSTKELIQAEIKYGFYNGTYNNEPTDYILLEHPHQNHDGSWSVKAVPIGKSETPTPLSNPIILTKPSLSELLPNEKQKTKLTYETMCELIQQTQNTISSNWDEQQKFKKNNPSLDEHHVFDENKSVKWNREQVQQHNDNIKRKLLSYKENMSNATKKLIDAYIQYIMDEYEMPQNIATLIYNNAYDRGHAAGYLEVLNYISHYAEFAQRIIKENAQH